MQGGTLQDQQWMMRALSHARRGEIGTAPNPRVGCILVRDGREIAHGWHARVGEAHAEAAALDAIPHNQSPVGATAYVTLEPCSHHGRTPPCSDALISAGISRCVVGTTDPNPVISGRGLDRMRSAGIEVTLMDAFPEGRWLNRRFLSSMERNRPWIVLKCAVSADGFMDPPRRHGEKGSLSITSPALRRLTHRWRAEEGAILVGSGTVITDDPELNVREAEGPDPLRIVMDLRGRTTPTAKAYGPSSPTLVLGGPANLPPHVSRLSPRQGNGYSDLMDALQQRDVRSVLVEGGADTLHGFLEAELWDELRICRSNQSVGGGVAAPEWPNEETALLRGHHPFGSDTVEYRVHKQSAEWVGMAFPPTLSIPLP